MVHNMDASNQPSAVVIDLDNTLYDYDPCNKLASHSVYEFLAQELNIEYDAVKNAWLLARESVKASVGKVAASHSRLLYAQQTLIDLGFGGKPGLALQVEQIYWSIFMSEMKPTAGVIDFLSSVRFRRIPLVLVTDLTSQIQIRKLVYLGWETLFDFVVTSELVGAEKTSGKPFDYALQLLSPDEKRNVWFIGDELHDVPSRENLKTRFNVQESQGFIRNMSGNRTENLISFSSFFEIEKTLSLGS